jgi:23S rRNA (uridine2552-2'-O)-methyltransferase
MSRRANPYARPDARTRAAKASGYPARSVFKLEEIDQRLRLFRAGMRVLDLGAAPGSWTMYASQHVGPHGRVLAIDLQGAGQAFAENVTWIQGDALELGQAELVAGAPYDLILSDMAPSTSGSKVRDQALSFDLFMRALDIATLFGRSGSKFVGKLFMSPDFQSARTALGARFQTAKVIRPEGTRQQSSELFLAGLGLRGVWPCPQGQRAGT